MNEQDWNGWCLSVVTRLGKIEKSLSAYHKLQKRMLFIMFAGYVGVICSGLLLYYS